MFSLPHSKKDKTDKGKLTIQYYKACLQCIRYLQYKAYKKTRLYKEKKNNSKAIKEETTYRTYGIQMISTG